MKLRHALLILCTLFAVHSHFAHAQSGAPASSPTNQVVPFDANNVPEAKPPGPLFTNAVGMVLTQIPDGYWAGVFEVTQKEFQKIMGANPSAFVSDTKPVDSVTFDEAVDFCKKMTALDVKKKFLPDGFRYTLPTENEWSNLVADATLDQAVTSLNGGIRTDTAFVGTLQPNSLGLFDVRGNVMEFILSDETQPYRILKGGSWQDRTEINLRPEFRWYCKPDERLSAGGFRCILKAK